MKLEKSGIYIFYNIKKVHVSRIFYSYLEKHSTKMLQNAYKLKNNYINFILNILIKFIW